MSAFLCTGEHFKALAIFAANQPRMHDDSMRVEPQYLQKLPAISVPSPTADEWATLYASVLKAENVRSVRHRYPKDADMTDDSPIVVTTGDFVDVRFLNVKAVQILKLCDCLAYQSCETDDWEQSAAYELIAAIRFAAIRALPGYEAAPWGFPDRQEITQ
jgi:hypothetical protein